MMNQWRRRILAGYLASVFLAVIYVPWKEESEPRPPGIKEASNLAQFYLSLRDRFRSKRS